MQNFLDVLEEHYQIKPIIYTTYKVYRRYIEDEFEEYPLWIRNVYYSPDLDMKGKWQFWQYTDRAVLEGYEGAEKYIDLNVFGGTEDKWKGYFVGFESVQEEGVLVPCFGSESSSSETAAAITVTYKDENGCERELFWCEGQNGKAVFPEMAQQRGQIPYVPLGSGIFVHFSDGQCPEEVVIQDMILNEDGTEKYGKENVVTDIQSLIDTEEKAAWMYLGVNRNALKSTDPDTYRKGGVLRGFRILCYPGSQNEREYDLLLRTDAVMGSDGENEGVYLMEKCGTGIPVFADIHSVEKDSDGLAVSMSLENVSSCSYFYGEDYRLIRLDGKENQEIPYKEDIGWHDTAYELKKGKRAEFTFPIEKIFGALEPGIYAIQMELTNQETKEMFLVSELFQFIE